MHTLRSIGNICVIVMSTTASTRVVSQRCMDVIVSMRVGGGSGRVDVVGGAVRVRVLQVVRISFSFDRSCDLPVCGLEYMGPHGVQESFVRSVEPNLIRIQNEDGCRVAVIKRQKSAVGEEMHVLNDSGG